MIWDSVSWLLKNKALYEVFDLYKFITGNNHKYQLADFPGLIFNHISTKLLITLKTTFSSCFAERQKEDILTGAKNRFIARNQNTIPLIGNSVFVICQITKA